MHKLRHLSIMLLAMTVIGLSCSSNTNKENQQQSQEKSGSGQKPKPKNVILMIGDGMGVSQIYAGMTVSSNPLVFEQFKNIGLQKTYSKDNYITDSGASNTALATGEKTANGHIAMSPSGDTLTTILEMAEQHGYATGLVSTSSILHATPAAFIAHNKDRHEYASLAEDFLKTDVDVFIGGGYNQFANRDDNRNLVKELEGKGYQVLRDIQDIEEVEKGKLAGLTADKHNPKYTEGRGNMLPRSTQTALDILDNNAKGFFLMVEGSQIDWGGHANDTDYIVNELLDFNRAVEKALAFAKAHENTLLIVTADHETGGMALTGGDREAGQLKANYGTDGHTGVMVPVFAYGPGSEKFRGIYENTAVFDKMQAYYGFDQ